MDSAKQELVDASLYFLRAVGNVHGSQSAMDAWTTIADSIDPELKGLVFTAMLNGGTSGHITITKVDGNRAIQIIKAIRTYDKRMLGLKEAKDLWDAYRDFGRHIKIEVNHTMAERARKDLRDAGCTVV